MKIEPRGDRILVKKVTSDKIGRIIMPDQVKKGSLRGVIVAVGERVTDYIIGDDVLFGTYAPLELQTSEHDDLKHFDDLFILNCEDIVAIISSDTEKEE